jgi:hypothetical protein
MGAARKIKLNGRMATQGVGVLINTSRLKDPKTQDTPYYIVVDAKEYYGKSPEDAVRQAKKAFSNQLATISRKAKKQKQTAIITPTDPMAADLKILGLSAGATAAEIKAAWAKLTRAQHPNMGGTGGNQDALKTARDRLLESLKTKKNAPAAAPAAAANKPLAILNAAAAAAAPNMPLAILNTPAKGGSKMRKPLKRTSTFRKKRSTTRKHLK